MKRLRLVLLGLLLAIAGSAVAIDVGGLQSQPQFRALTINNGANVFFKVDTSGNVTAANAASVPWASTTYCSTACSAASIKAGQTLLIVKPSATVRTSTATPSADPDLSFTSVPIGTYLAESWTILAGNTTGSGGYQTTYVLPTLNSSPQFCYGYSTITNGTFNVLRRNNAITGGSAATVGTTTPDFVYVRCLFQVITGGQFALSWAQNSSNTDSTSVQLGSTLSIYRIS